MQRGFSSHRTVLGACLALFVLAVSVSVSATPPGLMLSYRVTHDLLRTTDHFSVSVYEDGLALVHYPDYMEQAGDYSVQLSASELQALRLLLEHPLVQGFDPGQAAAEKRRIDAGSPELFAISDDSWSHFEIRSAAGARSIRWANLEIDEDRYPDVGVFRKLAEIERELRQLDQHPTATAVDG